VYINLRKNIYLITRKWLQSSFIIHVSSTCYEIHLNNKIGVYEVKSHGHWKCEKFNLDVKNGVLVFLRSECRLLVTASVVPSSPILVTLMKEALRSSKKSVLTRATRRKIPEDAILHSHRHENLKSYIALTGWTV
jgi:hypothetical protein